MTTLSKNVVFNLAGQGLVLLLSFVAVRFIFRQLGDDIFGIIYFSITLSAVLTTVLELGISSTTVREVSRHYDSEPSYITALIQTASFLYWTFGLLILLGVFVTAPILVEKWINLRTTDVNTAATVIRILGVGTMAALPRALYTSLFRGRQRMALNNIIDVVVAIVQQLGIVALLKVGVGVFAVVGWISASTLLGLVAYVTLAQRLFGWRAVVPGFNSGVVRRNLSFTTLVTANSLLSLVYTQTDKVLVSKLLPVAEFGLYGFASATVGRASFVPAAIGQAAFPSFSNLFAAGDRVDLLRQYRKFQDLVCFGTLPMFAGICFAALPLYGYLFNSDVAGRLLLPTVFLAVGFAMNAAINTPNVVAVAMGKPQLVVKSNVLALFVVLPVTVLLVASFGITGAAFSWVFYHLFTYTYLVPRICRECLEIRPWLWYVHAFKAFGLALIAYGLSWQLLAAAGSFSLGALAFAYVVGSAIFVLGAYLLIGTDLRGTLLRLPRTLMARG